MFGVQARVLLDEAAGVLRRSVWRITRLLVPALLAAAAELIAAGKVSLNGRECLKPDRAVEAGDVLSCRGLGKCVVKEVLGQSKKGRIMLVLERYI